jgi:hypothetical protein
MGDRDVFGCVNRMQDGGVLNLGTFDAESGAAAAAGVLRAPAVVTAAPTPYAGMILVALCIRPSGLNRTLAADQTHSGLRNAPDIPERGADLSF